MDGIFRINRERKRQIEKEGWDKQHDATHKKGELVMAAICYAVSSLPIPKPIYIEHPEHSYKDPWPRSWDGSWDKRRQHRYGDVYKFTGNSDALKYARLEGRVRCLEIAGALIAAEIDRIQAEIEA